MLEEDIKRCEQLIKPEHANWIGISNQLAISHLIDRINELEEENSKLKRHCKETIKDKQELTTALLNSIPVQKVKDKIEELDKLQKEMTTKKHNADNINDCYHYGDKAQEALYKKEVLEEILEDK